MNGHLRKDYEPRKNDKDPRAGIYICSVSRWRSSFNCGVFDMKPKVCKSCKKEFKPSRPLQQVCSVPCARKLAIFNQTRKAIKEQKKDLRKRKEALKTAGEHKKELQVLFNKFIRLRDEKEPCISCQRHHQGQYHAGHFLSVGARPNLRFNELNCHKQCAPCNNHLSGNITEYRINLITKIGVDAVERLESNHTPAKYSIEQISEMKKYYRNKIKQFINNNTQGLNNGRN